MEYTPIWSGIIACYSSSAAWAARVRNLGFPGLAPSQGGHLPQARPLDRTDRRHVGLVLLMFDAKAGLHNPLRFALLLANFGSVMTWGVVILAAFVIVRWSR